jgi:hypothetical protein
VSWNHHPICRYCGQPVADEYFRVFEHVTCRPPAPAPTLESSDEVTEAKPEPVTELISEEEVPDVPGPALHVSWAQQKLLNRVDRYLRQIEHFGGG